MSRFRVILLFCIAILVGTMPVGQGIAAVAPSPVAVLPSELDSSFRFVSMGDSQAESARFSATVNQISTLNPALVIFNGDLEQDGVVSSEMDPMIGALKSANLFNNTFLVRGNHDDHVSGSATLWENYFEAAPNIKVLPAGVTNYVSLNSGSDYLTYSFNYGNSIFIGLDVPGGADLLTTILLNFLDARLTYAEGQGLTHAFIFFHGPLYCVESTHCNCSTKTDASCTPSALVSVINKHPIVSATFHGHEHILGWTHMDNTRVAGLTGSFEQFITSPSGGYERNSDLYPARVDYADMGTATSFATIDVSGDSFTFSMYRTGTALPVWSKTFSKSGTPTSKTITYLSTGAMDGWILESSETSNKGSTMNSAAAAFRLGDDAAKKQYRSLLSFKTASLPDNAAITKVTLKIRQNPISGTNLIPAFQGLFVDVKKGFFGTSANLQVSDFQAAASKTVGPFKPVPASGWYTINLSSAAFAYINKLATGGGVTQIRLRFKLDDNNNNVANVMSFFSGNAASNQPQLIITYTAP